MPPRQRSEGPQEWAVGIWQGFLSPALSPHPFNPQGELGQIMPWGLVGRCPMFAQAAPECGGTGPRGP